MRKLQRFFFSFPDGLPGFGLLLLRIALGAAVIQGGIHLSVPRDQTTWLSLLGVSAIISGILLLIGFLTPVITLIVCIGAIAAGVAPWFLAHDPLDLHTTFCIAVLSAGIFLLGPGAFSFDARLFGRREIVIPDDLPALEE